LIYCLHSLHKLNLAQTEANYTSTSPNSKQKGRGKVTMRAHISQSRRIILCLISLLSLPFCSAIFFQECRDPDQEGHTQNYCPTIRYCSWNHYSSVPRSFLETGVGYDESSWNLEKDSQSLVDQTRFGALDEHVQLKLELLGYDEDKHDCCNNHYEDYDWEDFDIDDGLGMVLAALELIGYDETTWNAEDGVSEYEDYTWEELPREIQFAATYSLCYTKETWDEIPLSEWSIDTILPGSCK